jgi:hypothetical protein
MRQVIVAIVLFLTVVQSAVGGATQPTRVENATAGISIEPPPGWHTATVSQMAENREKIRLSDAELEKAVKAQATPALFAFMKHPEPYDNINPSISIILRPAPPSLGSATQLLDLAVGGLKGVHKDFTIVEPTREVTVGGLPGAGARVSYTLRTTEDAEYKVLARMWAVKRGSFLILVGMSGAQEGADVAEEEFATALASLRITP